MKTVSFVIPVFNEAGNIEKLFDQLKTNMLDFPELLQEFIFINDGSYDNSLDIIKLIAAANKNVKVISFTRNFGHQAAIIAGLNVAKGDAVITMDCDFQDPPHIVPVLIRNWLDGYKVVYTRRTLRSDNFFKKMTAHWYYKLLNWSSEVSLPGHIGDFRLMDSVVLKHFQNRKGKEEYLRGLIPWLGYKYIVVDFERPKREKGETGFSLIKMIRFAMKGILSFSLLPLRLGLVVGAFSIFSGMAMMIYLFINYFVFGQFYKLLEWLAVMNFILIGFLFILLWVLAEYINGIKKEVKELPDYIIEDTWNLD
ncbi:MAG: glycosyltransferase family 2 protein [Bacteroidales bacterium]|nr:glycosyltransferase family 2 protein [Bacteroidales bacterium]